MFTNNLTLVKSTVTNYLRKGQYVIFKLNKLTCANNSRQH